MDIHPVIVHLPIAFLTIYSLLEIISIFKKPRLSKTLFSIKYFLLGVGFFGTIAALMSGENAFHLNRSFVDTNLVHTHEEYAEMTRNVYLLLFILYTVIAGHTYSFIGECINKNFSDKKLVINIFNKIVTFSLFIKRYYIIVIALSVLGLFFVSITGALGGALVFGLNSKDPFIHIVTGMLGF